MGIIRKIYIHLAFQIEYYIFYRSNPISYLRSKGAIIGDDCDIIAGVHSFGSEPYLVKLGNNVTLSGGAKLITHDGATRVFRKLDQNWKPGMGLYGVIEIGDNVFIGANSIVLPNVHIGSNVIIGAGSVVSRDIDSGSIAVGVPARVIGSVKDFHEKAMENAVNLHKWDTKSKRISLVQIFWKNYD